VIGLRVQGLVKAFSPGGRTLRALDGVDLEIPPGSLTAIVGRSGCGKTTLLRTLGGLETPDEGAVAFFDSSGPRDPQSLRRGMVFQEPRLFPWLSVRDNIAFPLGTEGLKPSERTERVEQIMGKMRLRGFEDALPHELSGGMAQRAALGRTLCFDPDLLLLDEPFGALDYFTRRALQHDLAALFHSEGKTVVLVTHDVEEALALGQRVLLLGRGRVLSSWTLETPPGARAPDDPAVVRGRREILRYFGQNPDEGTRAPSRGSQTPRNDTF